MRISERLLTVLALCLLAAAVPAFAKGSAERRLEQAQELIQKAQAPLSQAQELLRRDPVPDADYDRAMNLISEAMASINPALALVDQVAADSPDQPDLALTELRLVESLIDAKQYRLSMARLVRILGMYPDYRPETDRLVARVMEVRRQFNTKYEELLEILKLPATEENAARGLAIIGELIRLDPDPDPVIQDSLDIALLSLENGKVLDQFRKVMDEAAAQLAEGRHADALATYRGGLDIGREVFDKKAYPTLVQDQVKSLASGLGEAAGATAANVASMADLVAALDTLLAAPVLADAARQGFEQRIAAIGQARDQELRIRSIAAGIPALQAAIKLSQGGGGKPDFWLELLGQSALGRSGKTAEGIAWAARQPWVSTARKLSDNAAASAESAYLGMEGAFARIAPPTEFGPLAEQARIRAHLALAVLEAEAPAYQVPEFIPSDEDLVRAADLATIGGLLRQHVADADSLEAFTVVRDQATTTIADLERSLLAVQPSSSDATALRGGRGSVAAIHESAVSGTTAWANRAGTAASGSASAEQAASIRDGFASIAARALDRDAGLARNLAVIETAGWTGRLSGIAAQQELGKDLQDDRRPDLAGEHYAAALGVSTVLLADIDAWRDRWSSEPSHVSESAGMRSELEQTALFRTGVVRLQAEIVADTNVALADVSEAAVQRRRGDEEKATALSHEKANRWTEAVTSYESAKARYLESLGLLENAALRNSLKDLESSIANARTAKLKQSVTAAETLISRGIELYTAGNFKEASEVLGEAKLLWDSVSPDTRNETGEYYLARAQGALTVEGLREIPPTHSLYEVVRGFMAQAEIQYAQAAALVKTPPPSAEALRFLDASAASLDVIRDAVPEYREMRLLRLKIDRIKLTSGAWVTELQNRVRTTLVEAKKQGASTQELRDAYLALTDYEAFEGAQAVLGRSLWDQLKAGIVDLGKKLGLIPADPDKILQAKALKEYNEANNRYRINPNNKVWWDWILSHLDKSIQTSLSAPEAPARARQLRSEILDKRGSPYDIMSEADNDEYREAVTLAARGDKPRARVLVAPLLQKYPRNPMLLELWSAIQ